MKTGINYYNHCCKLADIVDYYKHKFTIADNVQDILHRQEVESWEDLTSTFQVMEEISATGLQAVLHVLHNGQDIWKNHNT